MAAKAVVVYDFNGAPVIGAEVKLSDNILGLTNQDGYVLASFSVGEEQTYVRVLANGFAPAIHSVTLDDNNQEIHLGGVNNGGNTIYLPALGGSQSFPNYPTREQVCNVFCGFQGISILTSQFGWIPAFGPECGWLNEADCISYCAQMKKFGFTHVEFDISGKYDEPSYQYPVMGIDYTSDLQSACRRVELIIKQGMFVKFSLAGDGMSNPDGSYNDPYGWTYGFEWLMNNLAIIIEPFTSYNGHDLTRFIQFVPGYDGVFYGWSPGPNEVPDQQPQRVIDFGNLFRSILPDGYLGIEHTTGKIPVGEGAQNWITGGVLDSYDTLYSEYNPFNLHEDSTWQIVGRCTRPYNRPSDQPSGDDPNPPYYLQPPTTRGIRFYIMYELLTYLWVRNEVSIEQCNETYDYFKAMAPNATLCMIRQ